MKIYKLLQKKYKNQLCIQKNNITENIKYNKITLRNIFKSDAFVIKTL